MLRRISSTDKPYFGIGHQHHAGTSRSHDFRQEITRRRRAGATHAQRTYKQMAEAVELSMLWEGNEPQYRQLDRRQGSFLF